MILLADFVLMLWADAMADPYRMDRYTDLRRCRYDIPFQVADAEAQGLTHITAGCAAAPLAPLTSLRPVARPSTTNERTE